VECRRIPLKVSSKTAIELVVELLLHCGCSMLLEQCWYAVGTVLVRSSDNVGSALEQRLDVVRSQLFELKKDCVETVLVRCWNSVGTLFGRRSIGVIKASGRRSIAVVGT